MLRRNKMSVELKIKSKHLSEEARIIRFEERKLFKQYRWALNNYRAAGNNDMYPRWNDKAFMDYASLNHHRRWDVRNENRATFLARAYIAGVQYNTVEHKRKPENEHVFQTQILPRVFAMVLKYGKGEDGDWEWEKSNQGGRYIATKQLKDKIIAWSKI
jgi:hypothetical protein